jgi:hypothetical protein
MSVICAGIGSGANWSNRDLGGKSPTDANIRAGRCRHSTLPARGIYEYGDGDPEWIGEEVFFTCEVNGGQKE